MFVFFSLYTNEPDHRLKSVTEVLINFFFNDSDKESVVTTNIVFLGLK